MIPLYWVDAFAEHRFGGNPAAVCLLDGPADEAWMQALAAELGLAETAFTWPEGQARRLRWFTPTTEVDLCGHATLAAAHALAEGGRAAAGETLSFLTRAGTLAARLDGGMVELDLPADPTDPVPAPDGTALGAPAVAAALGARYLVVEVASAGVLRGLRPDPGAVALLHDVGVVVTAPGDRPDVDYVLRVFAPRVGIGEDPVTGSAQCPLGPYWADRLGRDAMEARQESARGGRLRVRVRGDRVLVAGGAVTVLTASVPPP